MIGLMLITASSPASIKEGVAPQWVEEWIASRAERAEKAKARAEAPPKPVDKAAQAKRREQRLGRIAEGMGTVKVWSEDLVRGGLANVPAKGYAFFDEPARRMVDAQAPGVARRIRALGETAASGAGWQRTFLEQLASIHLLARAVERLGELPPVTREDVLSALGVPPVQAEEEKPERVRDAWQVIAQERGTEEMLRFQRTWLFGRASGRAAVVLEFAHGTGSFATTILPATEFEGEVEFHPGTPMRATVPALGSVRGLQKLEGFDSLRAFCEWSGDLFAQQPWQEETVAPLTGVVPVKRDGTWVVVDSQRAALPAMMSETSGWLALAVSGGYPVDLVAAYDGRRLRPLALVSDGEYVALTSAEAEGGGA